MQVAGKMLYIAHSRKNVIYSTQVAGHLC